jgi:type VI secretion system protein ImpK
MPPPDTRLRVPRPETLALLYQNILTGIVRIQAARQSLTNVDTFRRRMKLALQEVEQKASAAGYGPGDIRDAAFAVVAFLDEAILSSKDPKAEEWRKRPLNVDLFGQAIAGDVFFDKLAEIERRNESPHQADLLEVFLLCLLLGFEGRFAPPLQGEAYQIMERLRGRVESIRGSRYRLSPSMETSPQSVAPTPEAKTNWQWVVVGVVVAAAVLFWVYRWNLDSAVQSIPTDIVGIKTTQRPVTS